MSETTPPELPQGGPNLWVKNYADYLYSYACTRIDDSELARDLVQETFLAALEGWEKFDRRSSEKTWLTAILKNKAYAELEKLAEIANKNYPKSMLGDYELGLMYEKMGDPKKAAKRYQSASQLEEIGNLTKDSMMEKYDDMISQTPKK